MSDPATNPLTGRQWDLNSLRERLLELQDTLLQHQERNIILAAQTHELERIAHDAEDLKAELANQGQLLADKSRENKHLHQELSRIASNLEAKTKEIEDLNTTISEIKHQLKTCQSERDRLSVMLTEVESRVREVQDSSQESAGIKEMPHVGLFKFLKGKQT